MAESSTSRGRRGDAALWLLQILLAAVFLFEGLDKFSERRLWIRIFDEIGFGQWFRYFTGVVEVSGAVMLLIPRTTLIAVGSLACTMIGALIVHVFVTGVGPQTMFVGILLMMLSTVGATRMNRNRRQARREGLVSRKQQPCAEMKPHRQQSGRPPHPMRP